MKWLIKARVLDKYKVCQLHLSLIVRVAPLNCMDTSRGLYTGTFSLLTHSFPFQCICYDFFFRSFIGIFVVVVPHAPPANVIGKKVTSTSIFVQWDEVPTHNQNGTIVSYTVTHTELPNGSPISQVEIVPKRNATLTGLKKFTNYSITVFASTAEGGGTRSDPIIVITDEDSKYYSALY